MDVTNRRLGGSDFANSWLQDYYANTWQGNLLRKLFGAAEGAGPAPDGMGTMDWPPVPEQMPSGVPAAPPAPPVAAAPAGRAVAEEKKPPTNVPGNQKIPPKPVARPGDLLGMLFGSSAPLSQEGQWSASPSQGPGEAVSAGVPEPKPTSILDALTAPPGASAGSASAPRAPAPPGPRALPPGMLAALLGGRNPLAQQSAPNLPLLSRLLGGR